MDTLKNYLDNIFKNLPKNEETLKMKNELGENMELRYLELRQNGKNENEALGITISEFGNIEDIIGEDERILLSSKDSDYKNDLKDTTDLGEKSKRLIGLLSSIIFPIATCIYLLSGFLFNGWGTMWIIFPITGILFAICSSIIRFSFMYKN